MAVSEKHQREAAQLLRTLGNEAHTVIAFVERQLNALHMRAQVVIGFAAVAVTTTGFSGRLIAGTNTAAQWCIIVGLASILFACLWLFLRVLSIDWVVSRYLSDDLEESLSRIIAYRDRKSRDFRIGSLAVFIGMCIYAAAIAIMLLNPEPITVPVR